MGDTLCGCARISTHAVGYESRSGTNLRSVQLVDYRYDRRTPSLGLHRTARPPPDAPAEPLACSALDPDLDDCRHAAGRWMAVVCTRGTFAGVWWSAKICRSQRGSKRCFGRGCRLQNPKESQPQTAAMPTRTALLVESSASRQIFFSIRPYHDGVLDRACTLLFLSRRRITSRIFCLQHRVLAHRAGHALPE